jgi:isochorismate pyruvate lyase
MQTPQACKSIEEIRKEIDRIDQHIIALIGERFEYVKEIVNFKSNADDVKAKARYNEVFENRRMWATAHGLDPLVVEEIYKTLVHYFIDEQMKILNARNTIK